MPVGMAVVDINCIEACRSSFRMSTKPLREQAFCAGKLESDDLGTALQTTELPQGPSLEWLQTQLLQHLLPQLAPGAGSRVEGRPHRSLAGQPRTSMPEFVANLQRFCTQLGSTLQQLNGALLPGSSTNALTMSNFASACFWE